MEHGQREILINVMTHATRLGLAQLVTLLPLIPGRDLQDRDRSDKDNFQRAMLGTAGQSKEKNIFYNFPWC